MRLCLGHDGGLVERGIKSVEVLLVELILRDAQAFAKALVMDNLAFAEELDGLADIGIVDQPQDVIIGRACLLLCCTFISANFLWSRGRKFAWGILTFSKGKTILYLIK